MDNKINLWSIESKLYALIDANGVRGNSSYKNSFELGNNHIIDVRITNFSQNNLSNHSIVDVNNFVISLNFRKKDLKKPWFRVDNESKDKCKSESYLHFHLDLGGREFKEHQEIAGKHTVAEVISTTFDSTYKIISEKFPKDIICDGDGFVGNA